MIEPSSYDEIRRRFRWEDVLKLLDLDPAGGMNLAHELVDRYASSDEIALSWIGRDGVIERYTFRELSRLSARFAGVLRELGVSPGDRVAGYLGRVPETFVTMLGAFKAGAIYVPLFTGFGPEAIDFRVRASGARVLVAHGEHRGRVPDRLPARLVTVSRSSDEPLARDDVDFWRAMDRQTEDFEPVRRRRDDAAVLLYTSGSTGLPKGVKIANNLLVATYPYIRYAVDLRPDDVFWPTGDPGWGYGLVCYALALFLGAPAVCFEGAFAPETALTILEEHEVTALATTPTALRAIMASGREAVGRHRVRLRAINSCGEPLNPEVVHFFRGCWGLTVMDNYGSSEFGLPIGNGYAIDMPVKPGSMGRPLPGVEMSIVDDEGHELGPDQIGQIAMRPSAEGYYSVGYPRVSVGGGW
ncbi:MAG: acetyl-CoA synthetase [Candidatus Rokuibacteriota bacterium]|nr:MAG: acetyl-CoA synthetase [Candidatus Rokubacteria bacterium]